MHVCEYVCVIFPYCIHTIWLVLLNSRRNNFGGRLPNLKIALNMFYLRKLEKLRGNKQMYMQKWLKKSLKILKRIKFLGWLPTKWTFFRCCGQFIFMHLFIYITMLFSLYMARKPLEVECFRVRVAVYTDVWRQIPPSHEQVKTYILKVCFIRLLLFFQYFI